MILCFILLISSELYFKASKQLSEITCVAKRSDSITRLCSRTFSGLPNPFPMTSCQFSQMCQKHIAWRFESKHIHTLWIGFQNNFSWERAWRKGRRIFESAINWFVLFWSGWKSFWKTSRLLKSVLGSFQSFKIFEMSQSFREFGGTSLECEIMNVSSKNIRESQFPDCSYFTFPSSFCFLSSTIIPGKKGFLNKISNNSN